MIKAIQLFIALTTFFTNTLLAGECVEPLPSGSSVSMKKGGQMVEVSVFINSGYVTQAQYYTENGIFYPDISSNGDVQIYQMPDFAWTNFTFSKDGINCWQSVYKNASWFGDGVAVIKNPESGSAMKWIGNARTEAQGHTEYDTDTGNYVPSE